MLADERKKHQDALIKKIQELSKELLGDDEKVRAAALDLMEIYSSDFRHSYSEFFPLILQMQMDDTQYNLDYFHQGSP